MATSSPPKKLRYADVGANLSDPIFRGIYHGKHAHDDDLSDVIKRAVNAGCEKFMITGSNLEESKKAVEIAEQYPSICYATIGVHPCSTTTFTKSPNPTGLLASLATLAKAASTTNHAVAFGEIGLDYDRLFLSPKETQLKYFEAQLDIATALDPPLPLFLHSRAAAEDFERLLKPRLPKLPKGGLVHSFTGSVEEMKRLLELGLHIGINGCSLKTEENLEVVRAIPLSHLQIETDAPWCEMRASAASAKYKTNAPPLPKAVKKEKWEKGCMVKGRNEPCAIAHVCWVVAGVKGIPVEEVAEAAWRNSIEMFGLGEVVN
ncbi:MAG: hypothetical protein M1834_004592 [Cirrosporium novae-zelandiae]|nr:MAG: hypothetical protein M1834_004592 [Cirrosporium novae-zelandiae]